ncbi:PREDICTED: uncharacterized protein LOC104807507 isoform X1 [Tarenaya hassleriana]|uniref:uncharacterized protein LOC104807507 isoform X1 n=1 Tax=Tarenaya hassleriana TaxID=28532 RepID=UPI00053C9F92|nr:PREDICTED: uncharacterized protein LOC104807507 isoform X1 [Tarenaya hassleriana]XP_010531108.1 PREDICTED: uncharacterized protein LOC104807507 isoform X1 [Tarenaya hassleriana]
MVRFSTVLLKDAGYVTDDSRVPSLQAVPEMKYGIPCLAPRGGKILSEEGDVQTFDDFVLLQKLMDYWIRIRVRFLLAVSSHFRWLRLLHRLRLLFTKTSRFLSYMILTTFIMFPRSQQSVIRFKPPVLLKRL